MIKSSLKHLLLKALALFLKIELNTLPKRILGLKIFKKRQNIIFFPYETQDCLLLHYAISKTIKKELNSKIKVISNYHFLINLNNYVKLSKKNINQSYQWQPELDKKLKHLNLSFLAPGLIDSFKRELDYKYLINGFEVDNSLFIILSKVYQKIVSLSKNYDSLVIADSAYYINSIFRHVFHSAGKDIYVLHPNGMFHKLLSPIDNEGMILNEKFQKTFYKLKTKDKKYMNKFKDYKYFYDERKKGRSIRDTDSVKAYQDVKSNFKNKLAKKVLYLHCIRDASNLSPIPYEKNFEKYYSSYDWTINSLSLISKCQDQWIIKLHPCSDFYKDENKIISYFLDFFKIDPKVYKNTPNTKEILAGNYSVYSYSGTIIHEMAMIGKKAIHMADRFPDNIGYKVLSKYEWEKVILNPPKNKINPSKLKKNTWIYLFGDYMLRNETKSLCSTRSVMPGDSFLTKLKLLIIQLRNINSINCKNSSKYDKNVKNIAT